MNIWLDKFYEWANGRGLVGSEEDIACDAWEAAWKEALASAPTPPAQEPIPMILHCPVCRTQHIDEGQWVTRPHRSHKCESCGHVWRVADIPTVGVSSIGTKGRHDSAPPAQEDEPVYQVSISGEAWADTARELFDRWSENGRRILYTRPNNSSPAQDDEPVAWADKHGRVIARRARTDGVVADQYNIPLYTRPDSELRKAAKKYLRAWDHGTATERAQYRDAIRAALNKGES